MKWWSGEPGEVLLGGEQVKSEQVNILKKGEVVKTSPGEDFTKWTTSLGEDFTVFLAKDGWSTSFELRNSTT